MPNTATLSTEFAISIPKAVRDAFAWRAGEEFVFIPKGKGVLIMPVPCRDDMRGIAKGADPRGYRVRVGRI